MKDPKNSFNDVVFVVVFSIFVFFGALFVFSEFKKSSENQQISVRGLENVLNYKVNNRIRKLEGRKIFLKSQIKNNSRMEPIDTSVSSKNSESVRSDLQLFEKSEVVDHEPRSQSLYDEVMEEVSYDDGNNTEQEQLTQEYKQRLIKRAREEGWEIELNDNLEITKQVRLKK